MQIYLDICCLNRPFDDQSQIRIRLESEAKLKIQEEIRTGKFQIVWSYILDYENSKNPYQERKTWINGWKEYAVLDLQESSELLKRANALHQEGLPKMDSLHIACAIVANCEYFLTTDDKVLKWKNQIGDIKIADPILFIKECEL